MIVSVKEFDDWYGYIYCISEIDGLSFGDILEVSGKGDLEYNSDENINGKTGYGYYLRREEYTFNGTHYERSVTYLYFTLDEMNKYFVDRKTYENIMIRDNKINQILN